MSFQGFGKNSGPGAPPTAPNPFAGNFPPTSVPPLPSPAQPLFAPPPFQPSLRPRAASPKWVDEYPTLAEAYNGQTYQRPAVTPSISISNAGRGDAVKSFRAQDKKRDRPLPSLFPDEGALRNSNTVTGRPRFSSPVWPNQNKLPGQFADLNKKDLSSVSPNLVGYGIGRTSPAKQDNFQVPKITRSPPVNYEDIEGLSEDSISVQTDSRRLSARSSNHPNTPDSHSHVLFAPSIRTISTEAASTKPPNSSVPKRSRSPSLNPSDKNFQGNSYDAQDDTERELQAKAKRLARFKDELSQPEPSSTTMGQQKVPLRGHDHAMPEKPNLTGQPLELTADYPSANTSTDYEGPDSASIIAGLCPEMCPDSERAERERKGDLDRYERVGGDRNQTSKSLAVKKYTRTAEREASLIRPMPILQKTMNYLLELLDQPYDDGFLGLYNFLWDRMRAIRMDLRMQHIFNLEAITMLEQMIRLHIIAMHELCEYTKGEGFSEGFDAHLNIEQMNKTSVELFQLYDDHRKNGIDVPTEKEFRGYYALLKLDKHPGYKVEPAELSLDLAKMTPEVRQAPDVLFARDVARSCRIGNYIAFFRLVRKSSYLQACLMHAHFAKLRTQALASLHSGLQSNQGIPVAHVAQWLGMEDEDIEDLLDYHGFSIKEFGEPYMVKEGPFLNSNDSGTPKCSKLVHQKKSKTMFEDVLSPSLMEQVSPREVKEVSFDKVYEQEPTPVQSSATQSSFVEVEMDSEPVSNPTKEVHTNQILQAIVNTQQNGGDQHVAVWSHLPGNISPTHDPSEYRGHGPDDARTDSYKFKFRNSLEKNKDSHIKTNALDIVPRGGDQERLPVLEMDVATEELVPSPEPVDDLNGEECISAHEDLEIVEAGTSYLDEELSQAKLKHILWKWRRYAYRKRELRKKKHLAADAALSSLSLGPPIRHYDEQQRTNGVFNIHHVVRERYDKHERSWSKLNVSEVVAGKLSERNVRSKCLCWKAVVCSQMDRPDGDDLEHRSSVSSLAAGSWFCSKIMPAGDGSDDDLITSLTGLSIWKTWIHDLSRDELICCLSIIKDTRYDNPVENVAGASAVMFLVYECIPLELQKLRLRNLVMSLPSGSGLPLLILSDSCRSDPSLVADGLGLNEIDKSRISCFFIVFLLENQNTVSCDGFFSDDLLREGLQWLASNSPSQPVLQSVKTQELVFNHLNSFMEVLDERSAYEVTPLHCISAFNNALDKSIREVLDAADSNPSCWPCPEIALLESCDEHKAVDWYLPMVGWSSAAGIEPVIHALNRCKLPAFPDDTSWLFHCSERGDNIENQKSRLEDCLSRYLSQTSQMMGFSQAKQEAHAVLQKYARLELHDSTYYIVPKWVIIFRRVCNWRLMKLLNGEISRTYVLKQNDKVTTSGDDDIHDEGDISVCSTVEPSLDEMLEVSRSLLHYPEHGSFETGLVAGSLDHINASNAVEEIEVVEREWDSQQNNNLGDLNLYTINNTSTGLSIPGVTKEADSLSELLEKCNMLQNKIDKNLSIYF